MKRFHLASYNRSSEGAIQKLRNELERLNALSQTPDSADYIIAVGDRSETFGVVLHQWKCGVPIIHLWAGEFCSDWSTEDEVYRTSMTLMSTMQLCTNETAKKRVESICHATGKKPNAHIVGNLMMDNLEVDESKVPSERYILVLYNPPVLLGSDTIKKELCKINEFIDWQKNGKTDHKINKVIWIEPNGDQGSHYVNKYVTQNSLPRPQFLGLLKNCQFFVTNSSCQYYEAPFFIKPEQVISIGSRNEGRESKNSNMRIPGATKKIIHLLKTLG